MALKDWLARKSPDVQHLEGQLIVRHLEDLLTRGIEMAEANGVTGDQADWVLTELQKLEQTTKQDFFHDVAVLPDDSETQP